jgi:hypothetical protein
MEKNAPPPYQPSTYEPSHPNTQGPHNYMGSPYVPTGPQQANMQGPQSYMGPPYIPTGAQQANMQGHQQYMGPPYMSPAPQQPMAQGPPTVIVQQMQQQQQQQQQIVWRGKGTSHSLCCLLCFLTGGLTLPCWIYACIVD